MSMIDERLTLSLGVLSKPIAEQLSAQGVQFDPEYIEHLQKDAEAISRVGIRGVITATQRNDAYERISKRVFKHIRHAAAALEGEG